MLSDMAPPDAILPRHRGECSGERGDVGHGDHRGSVTVAEHEAAGVEDVSVLLVQHGRSGIDLAVDVRVVARRSGLHGRVHEGAPGGQEQHT
jgi:hypothetical protein